MKSVSLGKKSPRTATLLLVLIVALTGFLFSACASMSSSSSKHSSTLVAGTYDTIHVPTYSEYEILSLIFVTTEEYADIDVPYLTYLALLKKAQELGGHDIINVSIEESKNCTKTTNGVGPYSKNDTVCKIKRYASALAIRYTKPITTGPLVESQKTQATIELVPAPSCANSGSDSKSILPF